MHELGLVKHVMKTVEAVCAEQGLTRVAAVTLEIGEVSGVLPEYLADCWAWARAKNELFSETELHFRTIPGVSLCEDCAKRYRTVEFARVCPACRSENTRLVQGNEFAIKEIEAC